MSVCGFGVFRCGRRVVRMVLGDRRESTLLLGGERRLVDAIESGQARLIDGVQFVQ